MQESSQPVCDICMVYWLKNKTPNVLGDWCALPPTLAYLQSVKLRGAHPQSQQTVSIYPLVSMAMIRVISLTSCALTSLRGEVIEGKG